MSRLGSLLEFDLARLDWRDALRGSIVTAGIMAVPIAMGDPKAAIPLSIGAVFTAIAEAGYPLGRRWRIMLWTTLWLMIASGGGSLISDLPIIAVLVTVPVAFICGAAGFAGARPALVGLLSLVVFAIYVGLPVPLDDAPTTAALLGLGGVIQTIVCVVVSLFTLRRRNGTSLWEHLRAAQDTDRSRPQLADLFGSGKPFLAHATRLTVVMVIATAISESTPIPHQYWLPMSVAWMSKPDREGTVVRVIHRLAGTILGLAVIGLIVVALHPTTTGFAIISVIGAAVTIAFIWVNYAAAVTGVTVWVMGLFAMVGDPVIETMGLRLLATIAAAALVLIASWPAAKRWRFAHHQV